MRKFNIFLASSTEQLSFASKIATLQAIWHAYSLVDFI